MNTNQIVKAVKAPLHPGRRLWQILGLAGAAAVLAYLAVAQFPDARRYYRMETM